MKIPLLYECGDLRVLVIGAGKTGRRRANHLAECGAHVTLIDCSVRVEELGDLSEDVVFSNNTYKENLVPAFDMIVACTDDWDLNHKIVTDANRYGKLSASSTRDYAARLSFPASYYEDGLWAAFSTSGKTPGLARTLKKRFADYWDAERAEKFSLIGRARESVRALSPEKSVREERLKQLESLTEEELHSLQEIPKCIRVGTRGSDLATTQTRSVIKRLQERFPEIAFETVVIKTTGDLDQTRPLHELGENVFVSEIERALLEDRIDFAVHSLKDLPSRIDSRLALAAPPVREDVGEVLLVADPGLGRIGTGSARRALLLKSLYPEAQIRPLRGNIETRIKKLARGEYDAIVVAAAALKRLGIDEEELGAQGIDVQALDILPALRQGLLGLEYRKEDKRVEYLLESIGDSRSGFEMAFETALLAALGGDCATIVGGRFDGEDFEVFYAEDDNTVRLTAPAETVESAREIAEELKRRIEEKKWST